MAEYLDRERDRLLKEDKKLEDGFAAFGKDVPYFRREAALAHCRDMGLTDTAKAMTTIDRMAEAIRRDEPYQAMQAGMVHLDLTGTYRLLAVLCTAERSK